MKTKLGDIIPDDLAGALRQSAGCSRRGTGCGPSCQSSYVALVKGAKREDTRRRRIDRVLKMITDYRERHPA
jgi:uncharacterized protein YdeI (YjbR/CyaY-like superfamily)